MYVYIYIYIYNHDDHDACDFFHVFPDIWWSIFLGTPEEKSPVGFPQKRTGTKQGNGELRSLGLLINISNLEDPPSTATRFFFLICTGIQDDYSQFWWGITTHHPQAGIFSYLDLFGGFIIEFSHVFPRSFMWFHVAGPIIPPFFFFRKRWRYQPGSVQRGGDGGHQGVPVQISLVTGQNMEGFAGRLHHDFRRNWKWWERVPPEKQW